MGRDTFFLVWIWVIAQTVEYALEAVRKGNAAVEKKFAPKLQDSRFLIMAGIWKSFVRQVALDVSRICPRCACANFQKILKHVEKIEQNQVAIYGLYVEKCKSSGLLQAASVICSAGSLGVVIYDHTFGRKCGACAGAGSVAAVAGAAASASACAT